MIAVGELLMIMTLLGATPALPRGREPFCLPPTAAVVVAADIAPAAIAIAIAYALAACQCCPRPLRDTAPCRWPLPTALRPAFLARHTGRPQK